MLQLRIHGKTGADLFECTIDRNGRYGRHRDFAAFRAGVWAGPPPSDMGRDQPKRTWTPQIGNDL
jgi:hypothetical protein